MNSTIYMLTGSIDTISSVMERVIKEKCFLSDTPNVRDYIWYPLNVETQVAEFVMDAPVDEQDLIFLSETANGLTIGVMNAKETVKRVISNGQVEVVAND